MFLALKTLTLAVIFFVVVSVTEEMGVESKLLLKDGPRTVFVLSDEVSWYPTNDSLSVDDVTEMFRKKIKGFSKSRSDALAKHLIALCEQYRFDPAFVLSVIEAESGFDTKARSRVGARGLMQIMPVTARYVAKKWNVKNFRSSMLVDPFVNLTIGMAYLARLRDRYRGHLSHFLAAYNAGPTKIDGILRAGKKIKIRQTRYYISTIKKRVPDLRSVAKGS